MAIQSTPQGVVAGSIPLFAGHPSPDLLPITEIQKIVDAAWQRPDILRLFNYGDEQGNAQLIDFLVDRLRREEGLTVRRENLMIIGGSTWGVEMLVRHLTSPGDAVLVDAPSYRDALHIFRDQQLEVVQIPIDEGGIVLSETERIIHSLAVRGKTPKFYYVVPNFQNPTGITLSRARRQAIVDLCASNGIAIIEDDVYRDIRFIDSLPQSFYALGMGANVFRLGSFSKTLAPGLRIGWLIAGADWIKRFVNSGMLRMGGGANPFTAAVVADYCRSGRWAKHVEWLRRKYRKRRDIALEALEASMPESVSWTRPEGGYFIWLRLPSAVHVDELEYAAQAEAVYFASGKGFYVQPDQGAYQIRLSFSYVPLQDLRKGIAVLARLIARPSE